MKKTLGGDRLGSGKKMEVEMHGYARSTHDLSYIWRSTMSAGTLVPFMCEVGLPGDTFDINLDADIKTHPTVGPLFGSYKVQLDLFQCPVRLYQGLLHNNQLGIGMKMATVKLPLIKLWAQPIDTEQLSDDIDNSQINPSCILSYLGIRGIGTNERETERVRTFNGVGLLAYWDIYKNYYANKQEEIGAVIHTPRQPIINTITDIKINGDELPERPGVGNFQLQSAFEINFIGTIPNTDQIIFNTNNGPFPVTALAAGPISASATQLIVPYDRGRQGILNVINWNYIDATQLGFVAPKVQTFPLLELDLMRQDILNDTGSIVAFDINNAQRQPYEWVAPPMGLESMENLLQAQEGLAIKTYQSDLFNNWLSTEWIDGPNGISEITAIDTSDGSFTIDTLNLSKKVYDMLNRIAVSGGSYDDWLDAVYTHDRYTRAESPIYHGGLIKELVFQEVVSNAESAEGGQPLGTLAGKGIMAKKHKGGGATIRVDEISYIIGLISLTPRVDYSQGNKWDIWLKTMDDFHKPALDEIGFQELITEQMAWWDTQYTIDGEDWIQKSAGKQPAWINYMTNVNRTYGNFAIKNNEMFMTLNRRYEGEETGGITDVTTYIDPTKFNNIFAQTSLDAQNFWAQIGVDITSRRKLSARIMPNL